MNKKLIICFLAAVFLLTGFIWVYAKHTPKSEATEEEQPVAEELKAGPAPMVISSDKILSVDRLKEAALERGRVLRTAEDLKDFPRLRLETDTDITVVTLNRDIPPKRMTYGEALQDTNWCRIRVFGPASVGLDPATGLPLDDYTWCWPNDDPWGLPTSGPGVHWAVYQDPEIQDYYNSCDFPYYPGAVDRVIFGNYTVAPCSLLLEFWIEIPLPTDSGYCRYPAATAYGTRLGTIGPVWVQHPGGSVLFQGFFDEPICVWEPFMAGVTLWNDDDFDPTCAYCYEPPIEGYDTCIVSIDTVSYDCVEPPNANEDSCLVSVDPDVWGHYENVVTDTVFGHYCDYCLDAKWAYNLGVFSDDDNLQCHSWWVFDGLPQLPGWYAAADIYGGVPYVQAGMYHHDDISANCPPDTVWYFKPPKLDFEVDEETGDTTWYSYAPDGVPDFHQYDPEFPDGGAAFCGPTALANCLWWLAAAGRCRPFWGDADGDGNVWDPDEANPFIDFLATIIKTDETGTDVHVMDEQLEWLFFEYLVPPVWLSHEEVASPSFEYLQYELRRCEDVLLLLGFWYYDETAEAWFRIGGHWVTMAGVDYMHWRMAISDPALNLMCQNCTVPDTLDLWKSDGMFLPHVDPAHVSHDDAGNVSHDVFPGYVILPDSPSPGGNLWVENYEAAKLNLNAFLGMNTPPELAGYQAASVPEPLPTIHTEIEYAKVISPALKHVDKTIESSRFSVTVHNEGGIGTDITWHHPGGTDIHAGYDGSLILGTVDNLAHAYGEGTHCYIPFEAGMKWWQDTLFFTHTFSAESVVVAAFPRHYTRFLHPTLPLEVEAFFIGAFDPEEGPCEDAIWVKYVIHNYGEERIENILKALYIDMDIDPDAGYNSIGGIEEYGTIFGYHPSQANFLFGMLQKPVYEDGGACGGRGVSQPVEVWPQSGFNCDTLAIVLAENDWNMNPYPDHPDGGQPTDVGPMLIDHTFSLGPSEKYCNEYIIWAYDSAEPVNGLTFGQFLLELMKQEGYYRGDVTCDGVCDLADVVFLINYVLKGLEGPRPFDDQGDVDCDGEVGLVDVVLLIGYTLKGGPPPIDKNRFFGQGTLFEWKEYETMFSRSGLVFDPVWKDLSRAVLP